MVKGNLAIFFDDGEKLNTFLEMIGMMKKAGILPDDLGYTWEMMTNEFVVSIFSNDEEALLQEEGSADDSQGPHDLVGP